MLTLLNKPLTLTWTRYWSSKSERDGANPFKDPLAIIGIVAILFPFLFVLVAAATGVIDLSVYR